MKNRFLCIECRTKIVKVTTRENKKSNPVDVKLEHTMESINFTEEAIKFV